MTLKAGDPAPDFALEDQHGSTVRLSALSGKKVVLYFYPKADTRTFQTYKPLTRKDAPNHA